ncbi:multicopper oxidase-domain-containing protein [Cladorrhinum sp. PSN259]|nr:multicopper oxidase-domain-containing protein [Cladorrhinum sp. PSN259]
MTLTERIWTTVTQFLSIVSLNSFNPHDHNGQVPIFSSKLPTDVSTNVGPEKGPRFRPPGHSVDGPGADFQCEYPEMVGWRFCSTPESRGCWLTDDNGNFFNTTTNYEKYAPQGILREYTLEITDKPIHADGLPMPEGKVFNDQYPGPWIQACWGDTVRVNVVNKMKHNGTSIHWHGIRQNQTMHMDGVNGVTQCPIAPGDNFVYEWKAAQYGSTWYHSHYSMQYADGLVGPLTLHGPSSGNFDEAADIPTLVTDWAHNSGFEAVYPRGPGMKDETILLNGIGNVTRQTGKQPTEQVPTPYTLYFEKLPEDEYNRDARPKRYLLRLINTSFITTFVFSIDNHLLTVVSSDFVPVHPYSNTSVLVGIGQRYNVIVEANPIAGTAQPIPEDGNFWIRTFVADCPRLGLPVRLPGYETNGILRYNKDSTAVPQSQNWTDMSMRCSDETYTSLVPIIPWKVGTRANGDEEHRVKVDGSITGKPEYGPIAAWGLLRNTLGAAFTPLRIDFNDPTILHFNNTSGEWPQKWIITPENYGDEDWVYLAIAGDSKRTNVTNAGAHPIHLHGHDFAILQQAENTFLTPGNISLKFDNPPRRDVVLLPMNGFVVIAFKTDNPGSWLLHCHIATHAAEGLAMQILERQSDANNMWPFETSPVIGAARDTCKKWNDWHDDCENWWPGGEAGCQRKFDDPVYAFQDDSGI